MRTSNNRILWAYNANELILRENAMTIKLPTLSTMSKV